MKKTLRKIRGVLHIHTSFSYDSKLVLDNLAKFYKNQEYEFMVLAEHPRGFTNKRFNALLSKCRRLSDKNFTVIPGLELEIEGLHILAIGIQKFIKEKSFDKVISLVKKQNGLCILAHPNKYENLDIKKISKLDGIELWDSKHDSRYFPRPNNFKLLNKIRKYNKKAIGTGGLDLHHTPDQVKTVFISVDYNRHELRNNFIIEKLRNNQFSISNGTINIEQGQGIGILKTYVFTVFINIFDVLKKGKKDLSRLLEKYRIRLPGQFLMFIRRFF
jgi:hypothetical protein